MKLAFVTPDVTVAGVLEAAALRRGHQFTALPNAIMLTRSMPFQPSVVVLDVREFRSADSRELMEVRSNCPDARIIVTAEGISMSARSEALRLGVLDVIKVPYNPYDVIATAENIQSADPTAEPAEDVSAVADLKTDLDACVATKSGVALRLTRLELRLLFCLCVNYPNVASTERLLSFGWGHTGEPDSYLLKTHISHLRRRLRDAGGDPIEIESRHSVGYVLTTLPSR